MRGYWYDDSNINSDEYQMMLKNGLFTFMSSSNIFQQDNAPCHTAKNTKDFFDNNGIFCVSD